MYRTPDERRWASIAHGSILLSLIPLLLFLGPVIAFIIWRVKRRTEEWVAFQALQATLFQIPVLLFWFVPSGHFVVLAGYLYALWATYQCIRGRDFKYILVGPMAENLQRRSRR
jgi:uncharacterized Tic20 family protein